MLSVLRRFFKANFALVLLAPLRVMAGVEQLDKIDAIATKPDSPYVVLLVASDRPWSDETTDLLSKKLAHYKYFVTSGQLTSQRPQAQGKKVRIILIYQTPPQSDHLTRLVQLKTELESSDLQFSWGVKSDLPTLAGAP